MAFARIWPGLLPAVVGTSLFVSWGSDLVTHIGGYTIQNWQLEQGLPQISVTSIAQTPDGYLWVGTFNGLARFDGVRFTVFHEGNIPELGNSGITQLQVDEQGALWIVTLTGGLVRLSGGQFTEVLKEGTPLLLGQGEFSNDSNKRLLVGDRATQPWRWWRIENGELAPLDSPNRSQAPDEPRFLFENSGVTWHIERDNLTSGSREMPLSVLATERSSNDRIELAVTSAATSRSGGCWLATETGIYRLSQSGLATRVAPPPSDVVLPMSLKEDGQGTLWGGKWGQGVYRLNSDGSWQKFSVGAGLADNHVNCLFPDREGSLWVGTGQGGLHRIRPRVFRMHETERGPNVVMGVTQDRQGRMWFAVNGGGLNTLAEGKLKPVAEPEMLPAYPLAYSVLADQQDAVWIGLYGGRSLRWRGEDVVANDFGEGEAQPMTPGVLFEDRDGTVWLGCGPAVFRYEQGRFERSTPREGFFTDPVTALAGDRSGTLYIGTDGGGLHCLREGRFTHFTEEDELADSHLVSLYMDAEDTLWIVTAHGGLSRFRDGRSRTAGLKDGLPTLTLGRMTEDGLGNLWVGSNRGIIRVSLAALNEYLDGRRESVAWDLFGLSDGLSTVGCVGASQPAVWRARDGTLWFATIKGVATVDPTRIPFNPLPPPVTIEEVALDDEVQADPFRELTVRPGTHRLEFRFSGLSLAAPEKVRFRHRLEPFDRDWIEVGTRRVAYYSGVRPGNYRFQVTACNNDGVWNETGAALGVVILPPWWMTWWFRSLMAVGVAGVVFGWYELRLHRLRRERLAQESFSRQLIGLQENERRRLAGELHDGLGQDLLVIASQAQLGMGHSENPSATATRLQDIAETARQAIQQARRMAHNLRPGLVEELGFTKAVRANADKAAHAAGHSLTLTLEDVDGLLPPEFEVNLFRITQESLNNVLKHAGASEAKITLTESSASLRLIIEDNGRGFDPSQMESVPPDQRGFGLRQIAERTKMMGGRLDLQSRPGHGTRLMVEIPLQNPRFHS